MSDESKHPSRAAKIIDAMSAEQFAMFEEIRASADKGDVEAKSKIYMIVRGLGLISK